MYDGNKSRTNKGRAIQDVGTPHLRWSAHKQPVARKVHIVKSYGIYAMLCYGVALCIVLFYRPIMTMCKLVAVQTMCAAGGI